MRVLPLIVEENSDISPCNGYLGHSFKNRHIEKEKDLPLLPANIGRRVSVQSEVVTSLLMLKQRYFHAMEKLLLWVVFSPLSSG